MGLIVLVFGNPLLAEDSLPLQFLPELRKNLPDIEFKEIDPTEGLEKQGRDLVIIDSVEGIEEVIEITSIDQLQTTRVFSMHDFDLSYNLKILKKLGMIDSIRIVGIPMQISRETALAQIQLILRKWAAQLIQGS
jgi:Ni,Fe-hydrogenase maturation factor